MIIAAILHESSSLSSKETSGWYVSCDLRLLKQKEGKEASSRGNFDDNEEFSLQEMKQEVVEEETYGNKENDAYPKDGEEKRNETENNVVSGNDVNVEGHSLHENLSEHEMKKKVEQEKKCRNGDPHNNCKNDDDCVKDGEESDGSGEDEDANMLARRIEELIARSHQRWKEEFQEENLNLLVVENDSSYYLIQMTGAQQRKVMPRTSRPKKAKNISKRERLQIIRRLIEHMRTKAKMIKMHSHPISTRTRFPVNTCQTKLPRVSGSHHASRTSILLMGCK